MIKNLFTKLLNPSGVELGAAMAMMIVALSVLIIAALS
jgi:hypothetical protein